MILISSFWKIECHLPGEETTLDNEYDNDGDNEEEDEEEEDVVLKDSLRTKVTGFLFFSFTTSQSHYKFFEPLHIC